MTSAAPPTEFFATAAQILPIIGLTGGVLRTRSFMGPKSHAKGKGLFADANEWLAFCGVIATTLVGEGIAVVALLGTPSWLETALVLAALAFASCMVLFGVGNELIKVMPKDASYGQRILATVILLGGLLIIIFGASHYFLVCIRHWRDS